MIDINSIIGMQDAMVERWHQFEVDNPYHGFQNIVCQQHGFNFRLWHEEDIARSPEVTDEKIAAVKRAIDKLNQQRNDWIEKIDDEISGQLELARIECDESTPLNTETPGTAIDRLSINSLRVFHLREQLDRDDVSQEHVDSVNHKIAVCMLQRSDLAGSLQQLMDDIFAGRKRHRTYRQFKMYNDPALNPWLYAGENRQAG